MAKRNVVILEMTSLSCRNIPCQLRLYCYLIKYAMIWNSSQVIDSLQDALISKSSVHVRGFRDINRHTDMLVVACFFVGNI